MTTIDFSGVFPAMVTPFRDDNRIDTETLREDAQRLEKAGVDGLVPVGSTGESATLSHAEHVEVIEAVVDAVEDVPVIAGTGSNNTAMAFAIATQSWITGAASSGSSSTRFHGSLCWMYSFPKRASVVVTSPSARTE